MYKLVSTIYFTQHDGGVLLSTTVLVIIHELQQCWRVVLRTGVSLTVSVHYSRSSSSLVGV